MPLEKSLDSSEIGKAIQKRIMTMQGLSDVKALIAKKQFMHPQAHPILPSSDETLTESKPATDNSMEAQESSQSETPRTKFRRQNAALHIIETDLAQNVSQVSPEPVPESAPEPSQMPFVPPEEELKPVSDTRLDIGLPKLGTVEQGQRPDLPALKRDKGAIRNGTSASMRKALKAGNRRWIEFRKALFVNQKQVAIAAVFLICICLVGFLMSGDDEDVAMAAKPLVEDISLQDISLPHVRVNPSLMAANAGPGRALRDDHDYSVHRNDED